MLTIRKPQRTSSCTLIATLQNGNSTQSGSYHMVASVCEENSPSHAHYPITQTRMANSHGPSRSPARPIIVLSLNRPLSLAIQRDAASLALPLSVSTLPTCPPFVNTPLPPEHGFSVPPTHVHPVKHRFSPTPFLPSRLQSLVAPASPRKAVSHGPRLQRAVQRKREAFFRFPYEECTQVNGNASW